MPRLTPTILSFDSKRIEQRLPSRQNNSHKGFYGHVLIVGGGLGMPGAPIMAAHAAYRVGAGLVSIATRPEYAVNPGFPEVMVHGVTDTETLVPLISRASVVILGPGLGLDLWAQQLFDLTIKTNKPLLIDASALHLLASEVQHDNSQYHHRILTPHPGEAAALLACTTQDIQSDRIAAVQSLQNRYGGIIVLKGAGTLIAHNTHLAQCNAGNPGMATAGMGDVLSGVIGGLLAQGLSLTDAVELGVWLHATAGDLAAQAFGERGLMATDLLSYLRQLSNPVS